MPRLDPAVADCRRAVRTALAATPPGALVVAAVSGGADSLALLYALAWEAPRHDRRAYCVTVDHGLVAGSAAQAERVVAVAAGLGVAAEVVAVTPAGSDEAAARTARYAALDAAAVRLGAARMLLGHTRDDQAESVLLGLARGSGARSLAGMAVTRGVYARPFLDLPRATTERACAALGATPWQDPANANPRHARTRVRARVLPVLEAELGPGIAGALARTADLARADADLLDQLAAEADTDLDTARLAALPDALRTRVLRRAAVEAGCPPTDLTYDHVVALDALLTNWHGQGPVALPGGLVGVRRCGTLTFQPPQ